MSSTDPAVMVLNGEERPDPPAGTALFHGMLGVVSEELEELRRAMTASEVVAERTAESVRAVDRRLDRLEGLMTQLAEGGVGSSSTRSLTEAVAGLVAKAVGDVSERVAQVEGQIDAQGGMAARAVVDNLSPAIEDVNDRMARVEQALGRLVDQADLRATTLATELNAMLATATERLMALVGRTDETVASQLGAIRSQVDAVAGSLSAVEAEVAAVSGAARRLAEDGRVRPVLEAIETASRENGELLATLHTALTRRIDAGGRSIGELADGVGAALARQEAVLEQMRGSVAERSGQGEMLREAFDHLEASMSQSLETVRSYLGEGLVHVSRRQAGTGKAMESAAAALASMERQLNGVAGLCQSLASGMEQHTGAASRVADLVLETRSALRGDLERLESTVHLEALKLHQQDQARLAGAASATTEVVERETALLGQRLSAVASAVETVRTVLHTHMDERGRGPLSPANRE